MARHSGLTKEDSFTFRLTPGMKAAITLAAAAEDKSPGELMRSLLEAHLAARSRTAFEEEARRQSLLLNARAENPGSDEAAVSRELTAHLDADAFGDEWTA